MLMKPSGPGYSSFLLHNETPSPQGGNFDVLFLRRLNLPLWCFRRYRLKSVGTGASLASPQQECEREPYDAEN